LKQSPHNTRFFYGWYVLTGCFFLLFFQSGARHSFGVMFKPMISQLGWDRASISLAFFLNMTMFALTLTIAGRIYDRYGPKWVIFISTVFMAVGYICISRIDSLWEFYLYNGVIVGIGVGGASVPLVAALMSKWFEKRRGLAISLAICGNCVGQFALVPLFTVFVIHYDWRASYFIIGLIILVVNTLLAFAVIKGDPGDFGLKPLGHQAQAGVRTGKDQTIPDGSPKDLGLRDAMRTHSFWLFLIAMFVCGSGDFLVTAHLIPWVTDYGISPTTAGNMLALFGLMSMGGILFAGPMSDWIGNKTPIALSFLLRIGVYILILKYQNLISFYIFAMVFGFTFLITAPLTVTLAGRLYGFGHVGLLSGFITTVHHFGGGLWAYIGGLLFDKTGSYRLIFILSAILALIALLCTIFIKEKRHLK
jgi:MFS family permease